MKRLITSVAAAAIFAVSASAQVVTTNPPVLTTTSTNIVLTYHPDDEGSNKALADLPSTTPIYAHIGLITSKSSTSSDWKYASTWLDNSEKYELKYVAPNTYELEIGDFASYFGVPASETVKQIALVFRDAKASKEGKTSSGGDILVDVSANEFAAAISTSVSGTTIAVGEKVHIKAVTSLEANITITANGDPIAVNENGTSLEADYTVTEPGSMRFRVVATRGDEQATKGITYTVLAPSPEKDYPGGVPQMGAVANSDGSVTFCLAAPEHQNATIVGSWDNYDVLDSRQMYRQDYDGQRYFWITIDGLDPDEKYPYYYQVDGTYRVGDPYARLILDPYNDKYISSDVYPDMPEYPSKVTGNVMLAVYWGNINKGFDWTPFTIPAHEQLVVYEMLFRDFTGTEGQAKGNGTVRQAIEKIPYIKELGVNAVELMPIMEFNGNNSWGYNTNFYFAPDKAYGTPEDYKEFIDLCHQNGLAVILDIVFNQSDGLHPWYQLYNINSNPFYNATAPHDYSVLNDWKQDHPLVQKQWEDCLRYWLTEYNVDGFRFDLVKGLGNNDSYGSGTENYNSSRVENMKRLHAVIKEVKPDAIHINEHLAGLQEEKEMGEDGQIQWGNFTYPFCQYAMGYSTGISMTTVQSNGRPWGTLISYAESHDEERVGYKALQYGVTAVKGEDNKEVRCHRLGAVGAQLLLIPGPKMIWQFGELGADQTTKSSDGSNNTSSKKVIWSRLDDPDYRAVHDIYAACARLRQDNPELFESSSNYTNANMNQQSLNAMRSMVLSDGSKEIVAFINPSTSGEAKTVSATTSTLLTPSNAQLVIASKGISPVVTTDENGKPAVSLPAHCVAIFATNNVVNGIEDVVADTAAPTAAAYGGIGEVVIVGEYNHAEVYTLAGTSVGRLTGLQQGIYLVRVDDHTFKVAVK